MTSAIDATKPVSGSPTTASVRSNFATAASEISALQAQVIPSPVPIANGGTNATTAGAALTNLGGAPLASPVFTGDARAVTPATGDADTSIATTAFVQSAVASALNDVGRNTLHNPMFAVAQRGTAGVTTTGSYPVDRWQLVTAAGDAPAVGQIAAADADRTGIGDEAARVMLNHNFTGGAAAGNFIVVYQRIEDVRRLSGKSVTISFYAVASAALRLGVSIDQNFGSGGSPSAAVLGTGQSALLTTAWARYSLSFNVPSAAAKTLGTNGDSSTQLNLWYSSGSGTATRAGIGVQSGTINLWGVQLEIGSVATPLEKPDPAQDLAKCQRFYQTVQQVVFSGYQLAANTFGVSTLLSVTMRAAPTAVFTPIGNTNIGTVTATVLSAGTIYLQGVTTATGATMINGSFTASADL